MSRQHAPSPRPDPGPDAAKHKSRRDRAEGPTASMFPLGRLLHLEYRTRNGYREYMIGRVVSCYVDKRFAPGWDRHGLAVYVTIEHVADAANQHLLDQIVPMTLDGSNTMFERGVRLRVGA